MLISPCTALLQRKSSSHGEMIAVESRSVQFSLRESEIAGRRRDCKMIQARARVATRGRSNLSTRTHFHVRGHIIAECQYSERERQRGRDDRRFRKKEKGFVVNVD